MRAAIVTAAATLLFGTVAIEAQVTQQRSIIRRPDGKVMESRRAVRPTHHDHGHHHGGHGGHGHHGGHGGHGHHGHGHIYSPGFGYDYGGYRYPGYGYGSGYGFSSIGVYGSGLSYYRGPAAFGGITPPVYAFPPYGYGYGGLGYSTGYGPTYGYGTAWSPSPPLYNSLQQYRYDTDWTRLSAELADRAMRNVDDPRPGTGAVPVPSTAEAKIKSARFEAMGDEAFANQDYAKALGHFKTATGLAKDNGPAFFKTGYAYVALGRFPSAIEAFKRGLAVDPVVAATGPTPDEVYGDHQLAWTSHLGRVTRWVAEDVRDAQRVFLLGTLLLLDGDTRAREFLEKAWQLSGGTETAVVTLLSPPKVEKVDIEGVAEPSGRPDEAVVEPAGPDLRPGPDDRASELNDLDLPELPAPPAVESEPSGRPYGQEPVFPLPSEQNDAADEPIPPLPVD